LKVSPVSGGCGINWIRSLVFFVGLALLSSLANSFAAVRGVAYFNMGAEYEHLKKASEALWHYQRVPFSVSKHDDVSTSFNCSLQL